nr:MAG TPA: hypothetical protein [Caudoviricetes sp.]
MRKRKQRKIDVEVRKLNQKVYNLRSSYKRLGLKPPKIETIKGSRGKAYKDLRKEVRKLNRTIINATFERVKYVKSTRKIKGVRVSKTIANEYLRLNKIENERRERLGRQAFEIAKEVGEFAMEGTYEQFYQSYSSERGFMKDNLTSKVLITGQQAIDDYFKRGVTRLSTGVDQRRQLARDNLALSIEHLEGKGLDKKGLEIYKKIVKDLSNEDFDLFLFSFQAVEDTFLYETIDYASKSTPIWDLLDKVANYSQFEGYFNNDERKYIKDLVNDNVNKYEDGKMVQAKQAMQKTMTSNKK